MHYTITPQNISVFFNSKLHLVPVTDHRYDRLVQYIKDGLDDNELLSSILDKEQNVRNKIAGTDVSLVDGVVYYKGQEVRGSLTHRMVTLLDEGYDVTPWVNFLDNLMDNPSYKSREQLFSFLDKFSTPLTADGHFLAFKRVRANFMDIYTGTMDNSPGTIVEMDRTQVDDNGDRTCSAGLHACASEYLNKSGYGNCYDSKVVLLKINPKDVVSIPRDYNFSKMRVCRYEVLEEIEPSEMDRIESMSYYGSSDGFDDYFDEEYNDGFGW